MTTRNIFVILIIFAFSVLASPKVWAEESNSEFTVPTIPTFPKCEKPQGSVKVAYETGLHGIVGDNGTYSGSDVVYQLSEDTLIQCFCVPGDGGIQTNWWKVSSLSLDQIEYLQALGWIYVPNGAEWGLAEAPYMAKNLELSCKEDKTVKTDDDDDDDEDDNDGGKGGIVFASNILKGSILAATGNLTDIVFAIGTGIVFLSTGAVLLKHKKND